MSTNQMLDILEAKGVRKVEINLERVVVWTLIFTNTFFVSFLIAKLFRWM